MDTEILARLQFAFTIAFHYIYPPMSIGLGLILVITEGLYLKTKNKLYENMARFWVKIFALTFAMGVATGIVMEFEFGTNWATYSRYVGDIFGSALAAEGIFAFFLESGFLAILVFGWNKVKPGMHFFATCMVFLGSMLSAVWIVVANSWQQTPAGYRIVGEGLKARAEITDFWAMVFNPSSVDRLTHVMLGSFLAGAFLVISISAYYFLKNKYVEYAEKSMKIGLTVAVVVSLLQLVSGHSSAKVVAKHQPAKLAAMEAHYDTLAPGDLYLFGWVDNHNQKVNVGVKVPKMLSVLLYGDPEAKVRGLGSFKPDERPNVNIVFQSYHIMISIGMALIGISLLGMFMFKTGRLKNNKPILWLLTFSVLLPQIGNQAGWFTAETGRQPWIVYGLLRTSDALSKSVHANQILFSLIMFTIIYIILFATFIFLLDKKIKHGFGDYSDEHDINIGIQSKSLVGEEK